MIFFRINRVAGLRKLVSYSNKTINNKVIIIPRVYPLIPGKVYIYLIIENLRIFVCFRFIATADSVFKYRSFSEGRRLSFNYQRYGETPR